MDVNELLEIAIKKRIIYWMEGFLVKELFKGYEWNRIAVKDRLLLGTLFLNHVHKKESGLMAIEKTSSHQQKYKKTTKQ